MKTLLQDMFANVQKKFPFDWIEFNRLYLLVQNSCTGIRFIYRNIHLYLAVKMLILNQK